MAMIEVNHQALHTVAAAIGTYCSAQDREMRLADEKIKSMLATEWLGLDAMEFGGKWEAVDADGSKTVELREKLDFIRYIISTLANDYQNAQANAYDAAYHL